MHKKLSTARDYLNYSHWYVKYLIVGLCLYKSNCTYDGLGNEIADLILNVSDLNVSF